MVDFIVFLFMVCVGIAGAALLLGGLFLVFCGMWWGLVAVWIGGCFLYVPIEEYC